jgi:hypothetical protein
MFAENWKLCHDFEILRLGRVVINNNREVLRQVRIGVQDLNEGAKRFHSQTVPVYKERQVPV